MSARADAVRVLRAALADGPRPAGEVAAAAARAGVSVRTLRRAADALGVVRTRVGTGTTWSLPSTTDTTPGADPDRREETPVSDPKMPAVSGPLALLAISPGLTVGGRVLARGDRVVLDADAVEATRDRHGQSWCDDLSPAAQTARWGAVHLAVDETDPETVRDADTGAETVHRPAPFRPDPVETVSGPRNLRLTPEGSVPWITGLGGDGAVSVVADDPGR